MKFILMITFFGSMAFAQPKLSWDTPARAPWSDKIFVMVNQEWKYFGNAKDAASICSNFNSMSDKQKHQMIAEFIIALSYFESGWNPISRMMEPQRDFPKPDPVTKKPVWSEGLMQLSYQDKAAHPYCKLDWNHDKGLSPIDPKKTILDPINNLDCGIQILAEQVKIKGTLFTERNYYWSVISKGNVKYGKVAQIKQRVKKYTEGCQ